MRPTKAAAGQALFSVLAEELLADPAVTRSTMMGYPCLRAGGAFFACVELATGNLIVKLPSTRVTELVACGCAVAFAPAGRVFREWAAFAQPDHVQWTALVHEAHAFVTN